MHQTDRGAKICVIATDKFDATALKQELIAALAKAGLGNADVDIECVDELERHKETGKLRSFIPLSQS